jgi:hypothetical protein
MTLCGGKGFSQTLGIGFDGAQQSPPGTAGLSDTEFISGSELRLCHSRGAPDRTHIDLLSHVGRGRRDWMRSAVRCPHLSSRPSCSSSWPPAYRAALLKVFAIALHFSLVRLAEQGHPWFRVPVDVNVYKKMVIDEAESHLARLAVVKRSSAMDICGSANRTSATTDAQFS